LLKEHNQDQCPFPCVVNVEMRIIHMGNNLDTNFIFMSHD
jgi:hypothetical protein